MFMAPVTGGILKNRFSTGERSTFHVLTGFIYFLYPVNDNLRFPSSFKQLNRFQNVNLKM